MARLKVYFDGGCRPNPGPIEVAAVARGVTYHATGLGEGTNNDAEWLALLHALRVAQSLGVRDFELLGDSTLVVNQARGDWKCRGAALQAHLAAFTALAAQGPPAQVKYVRRAQNLAGIALERVHGRG